MRKHIITISGYPGSGKSATVSRLAQALGYEQFSSGDFLRHIAIEKSLSIDEITLYAKTNPSIDHDIDERVKACAQKENLVLDSRLAFHWIPQAFRVFLKLDPHIAAQRTFAHIQNEGRVSQDGVSAEEIFQKTQARITNDQKRYLSLYNIDYLDEKNYDLVLDTSESPLEKVAEIILKKYGEWLNTPE